MSNLTRSRMMSASFYIIDALGDNILLAILALSLNALADSDSKEVTEKTFDIAEQESATIGRIIYICKKSGLLAAPY